MLRGLLRAVRRDLEKGIFDDMVKGKMKAEWIKCRYCKSDKVWKYGKNRSGVQRFKCAVCGKVFLEKDALPSMRVSVKQLGDVIGQYYGGMSLKELRRQFEQQHSESLSRSSFDRWLNRFSEIAVNEAQKHHPKVSGVWLADECVLKIGGRNVWCWDIIDSDTRFLLATHLSLTRTTQDARKLMEKASTVAGKVPSVVITDSLRAYIDGIELAFGSETKHIQSQPFAEADLSTNKIERWHSTLRARIDIMRGLKSLKTAQTLLNGWLVHYNFFRTHESLNDRTPADYAGIKFPYRDWLDVIEGQRVTITPEPVTDELGKEHPERYKYPAYRSQVKRKARKKNRVSRKRVSDAPTTLKGIRR
jgi:putative transposase